MEAEKETFTWEGTTGTAEYYEAALQWQAEHCQNGHRLNEQGECSVCCAECGCEPGDPFFDGETGPCECRCHPKEMECPNCGGAGGWRDETPGAWAGAMVRCEVCGGTGYGVEVRHAE